MTPLRERMLDDLRLRNYSDRTIKAYLRRIANFARHFGKSPDQLGPAEIREYPLYLVKQKQCSWAVFNQTVCALRFFYSTTLGRKEMIEEIPYPRFEKRLPVVLSQTEVAALLLAVKNLKHRAILTTIYATGLRASEVTNLLATDIDSTRMIVQVRQGKGRKDRFVMLSPNLLTLLRQYWRAYQPTHWLFPGHNPSRPINDATCLSDLSAVSADGQTLEACFAPYPETLVRDQSVESGHRSADHPAIARPSQSEDHGILPARLNPGVPLHDQPS